MGGFWMNGGYIDFCGFCLGDWGIGRKKELVIYVGKMIRMRLEMRVKGEMFGKFKEISEGDEVFYRMVKEVS